MIAAIIVLSILCIILFLLCIPITLEASYEATLTVRVQYLFFKYLLYPMQKKEETKEEPTEEKKEKKAPQKKKEESSRREISETLAMVQDILSSAGKPLCFLIKKLHFRKVHLQIVVAKEDAHQTAVEYGRMNAYVYGAFTFLRNYLDLKISKIEIEADYKDEKQRFCAGGQVKAAPLVLLIVGIWFVLNFIAQSKKKNKNEKNGRNDTMSEHISGLTDNTMKNLKNLVDTDSIVGEPITTPDGTTIIPVSKVSFGFGSGGSDLPTNTQKDVFGGGSGGGVTIQPLAFLVISHGDVKLLHVNSGNTMGDHIVNMVPEMFDKISGIMKKDKDIPQDKPTEVMMDSTLTEE